MSYKIVVGLCVSAVIIVVLFSVAVMMGSTIEDTYTVTDTSPDGWNRTANTDLHSPANYWQTLQGLIILGMLTVIVGFVMLSIRPLDEY